MGNAPRCETVGSTCFIGAENKKTVEFQLKRFNIHVKDDKFKCSSQGN